MPLGLRLRLVSVLCVLPSTLPAQISFTQSRHDDVILARSIRAGGEPARGSTGPQRAIMILANYGGLPLDKLARPEDLREAFFGGNRLSLDSALRRFSYGKAWLEGDVTGWRTARLPACQDFADYVAAAVEAVDDEVDFQQYRHVLVYYSIASVPDGLCRVNASTLGPGAVSTADGVVEASISVNVGDEDPHFLDQDGRRLSAVRMVMHEFGHQLGLHHANALSFGYEPLGPETSTGTALEYANERSVMGLGPGHPDSIHKAMLGWLEEGAGILTVLAEGRYTISALESESDKPRALRVRRGTGNPSWLWIEYHRALDEWSDPSLHRGNQEGVYILYDSPQTPWDWRKTYQLDFSPHGAAVQTDTADPVMKPGETWVDPYSDLTLSVARQDEREVEIEIRFGSRCAWSEAALKVVESAGGRVVVPLRVEEGCRVAVRSGEAWIVAPAAVSGSGNVPLNLTVQPNSAATPRIGLVHVNGLPVRIYQRGVNPHPRAVIEKVAGTGRGCECSGDGGPALDADGYFHHVRAATDGTVYVADGTFNRIRTIGTDGIIQTAAGPAGIQPTHIAVAKDGTVYFSDLADHRIKKLTLDRRISTVAGSGAAGYSPDGTAAAGASLNTPQALVFDNLGRLVFSDRDNHCVRMIDSDGTLRTLAGVCGQRDDYFLARNWDVPVPATSAKLYSPNAIAADPNGGLFIGLSSMILKLDKAGRLVRYSGLNQGYAGAGINRLDARYQQIADLDMTPSGSLLVTDQGNYRVFSISPDGPVEVVAGDGSQGSYQGEGGPPAKATLGWIAGATATAAGDVLIGASQVLLRVSRPKTCTVTASAYEVWLGARGGAVEVNIETSMPGCGWSTACNAPWVELKSVAGTGDGVLTLNATVNASGSSRRTAVTGNGWTVWIVQAGQASGAP